MHSGGYYKIAPHVKYWYLTREPPMLIQRLKCFWIIRLIFRDFEVSHTRVYTSPYPRSYFFSMGTPIHLRIPVYSVVIQWPTWGLFCPNLRSKIGVYFVVIELMLHPCLVTIFGWFEKILEVIIWGDHPVITNRCFCFFVWILFCSSFVGSLMLVLFNDCALPGIFFWE